MISPQHAVAELLDELEAAAAELGAAMAAAILAEVQPIQAAARNDPAFGQRFAAFCAQHVSTFVATTRRGYTARPDELEFVRAVAVRRADDAFPLAELMEGLRVGYRVLIRRIDRLGASCETPPEGMLWLSNRLVDYMDAAGAVMAEGYRGQQRLSAARMQSARREILDDLLEGRYASRADGAWLAASAGFQPDERYCVCVLVSLHPAQHDAQQLASELTHAASTSTGLRFVVVRGDEVVGIFRSDEAHALVAQVVGDTGGARARAGLSTSCRGIAEVPRGYWEAVRALRSTDEAELCVDLDRLGPLRYLEFSADSVAQRLAAQYVGALVSESSAHEPGRTALLADTVLCYVDCGLNARSTAVRMGVHLNTIRNRLEHLTDVLGREVLTPVDFVELAVAIRMCRRRARTLEATGPG